MTLSEHHRYAAKTKTELIDEIINLLKQLRAKNAEIALEKEACAIPVYLANNRHRACISGVTWAGSDL